MFSGKTVLWLAGAIGVSGLATAADFNRDVRPILTSNCYKCHGPDAGARKAKLRLDKEKIARPVLKGLLKRISSHDPDKIMPPPKSGKTLTTAQIQTLRQWISQGAQWEQHWSLKPIKRPAAPRLTASQKKWTRNPIDHFIRTKQNELGFAYRKRCQNPAGPNPPRLPADYRPPSHT